MKNYLIALSIFSLVFAGCSAFTDDDADHEEGDSEVVEEEAEIDEDGKSGEEEEEEEAAAWLTYTDEEWGFYFEYPEEWTAERDEHGRQFVNIVSAERAAEAAKYDDSPMIAIDAQITIRDSYLDLPNNDEELSLTDWLAAGNAYFDEGTYTPTTVAGVDSYLVVYSDSLLGDDYRFIILEHEGRIYQLNFNAPNNDDYVIERNHMMESFGLL